ncbi:MAG TPA: hypothetical protein VFG30_23850 [Polyangiales bacterium]|nr:hypothetical protein [Polyangiales bacterium]
MNRTDAWGWTRRTAVGFLVAWVAACTPISKQSGVSVGDAGLDASTAAADGGDDAGSTDKPRDDGGGSIDTETPKGEPCETDGSMRCSGTGSGTRQREICQAATWMPTAECGEGEVCLAGENGSGTRCLGVANICRGNPSAAVCDAQGVMYHCGADGVAGASESCPSARSCQVGLAAMSCASCNPGEFRCRGDALEHCSSGGMGFSALETCAAGSCDAEGGRCRGAPCAAARSVCRGDSLWACAQGDADLHEVARCDAGLCDAERAMCNRCVPGLHSCDAETAVRCSSDGARAERVDCSAEGSHCVGAGQCVKCARDADCSDPGACKRAYCNLAKGTCDPQPQAAGSPCPTGVCSSSGACVSCVNAADCADPGDCLTRRCDAAGLCMPKATASGETCGNGGKCDGDGHCAACVADGDCPAPPACQVRHCDTSSGQCQPSPAPKGTRCEAGVCDGTGQCGGCNADADCPAVAVCQQKFCNPSTRVCEPKSMSDGGACNAAFGAGSCLDGRCVQCANDAGCSTAGVCQEPFCRSSDNTCQQRPLSNGADCGGGKVCDGAARCVECTSNLQCGNNATCVANACRCNAGSVKNTTGNGCNLDECAKVDDNRCGSDTSTGNTCLNTQDGFDCTCAAPWKLGTDQCFQNGSGRMAKNTSSWNVVPAFEVVCDNAFDTANPCPGGQLTWLNVCGLPDTNPANCSSLAGKQDTLGTVQLRRVSYTGALEQFGGATPGDVFVDHIDLPAVGDVILVQGLTALYVMRITAVDGSALTYDWAMLWRDTCWRPGGATCSAACGCPGGS